MNGCASYWACSDENNYYMKWKATLGYILSILFAIASTLCLVRGDITWSSSTGKIIAILCTSGSLVSSLVFGTLYIKYTWFN